MVCRLFTFFSALALLLCVAVLFLWLRSGYVLDQITFSKDRQYFLSSLEGKVCIGWSSCDAAVLAPNSYVPRATAPTFYAASATFRWANDVDENEVTFVTNEDCEIAYTYGRPNGTKLRVHYVHAVTVPHWFLAGLLAAPATMQLATMLLRNRARRLIGLCPVCGYDLRATPQRCPVCGTTPRTTA